MRILAIETSCDETSAAVVENGSRLLGNVVASSSGMHQKTGGVIPEIAAREQLRCIIPILDQLQNDLQIKNRINEYIDALAVTVGPGLIGSLLVGVETAKTLSYVWNKPLVPINHLIAHLYANWFSDIQPEFPALCLIVSGGHTEIILMQNHGRFKHLGQTRDDAAGEAFDKSARLLGLTPYNGGPAIAMSAEEYLGQLPKTYLPTPFLPRPMINTNDFDFSFSGLKTAVLKEVEGLKINNLFTKKNIQRISYEVQEAITDCLTAKIIKAVKQYQPKSLLIAGGVAANNRLREKIKFKIENLKLKTGLFIPPPKLCTDNASYIGACAFYNYNPLPWQKINADSGLEII